eukprot:jgi/Mesen1/2411/ME000157S01548
MAWILYALVAIGVLSDFPGALSAVESSERSGYLVRLSYTVLVNRFSAALTEAEVEALRRDPAVGRIEKSRLLRLHSTHTPAFLNLPCTLWKASGGDANAGEGLVIGVLDSGIWIESPAFADHILSNFALLPCPTDSLPWLPPPFPATCRLQTSKPYGPPPKYWRGKCQVTKDFPKCNKKSEATPTEDYVSPRDANGHGTHVASTAGGNHGYPINFLGVPVGKASGMAPRARLAAYKVAWMAAGSSDATAATNDIVAALDQAVADGVDVINYLLGGAPPTFLRTHGRGDYVNGVRLRTGKAFSGAGFTVGTGAKLLPLVYADKAARTRGSSGGCAVLTQLAQPLKVKGKIVICMHSEAGGDIEKGDVVRAAGGVGMMLANEAVSGSVLVYYNVCSLPTVHVTYHDGQAILQYARTKGITGVTAPLGVRAPALTDFSTRGPLSSTAGSVLNYVLKPDVAGPGVDIWAAWPGGEANMLSGTSMAAPHLAGVAALIKQKHPHWSLFAIKSAISTTSSMRDNKKLPIPDWRRPLGSAPAKSTLELEAAGVLDPGLVYDSSVLEMAEFLVGINEDKSSYYFSLPAGKEAIKPYELNVPNIAAPALVRTLTFKRVVKSVATSVSTYKAAVVAQGGVSVKLEPSLFRIGHGKSVTFRVVFTVMNATSTWSFGSLTWTDGKHSVRSVLAAEPVRK